MSLFNWLSRKSRATDAGDSSGLGHADATQPLFSASHPKQRQTASVPGVPSSRRTERLERRELLYSIVRECMTQSGVLSSKYKFKVLSLDSKGREYLIMIDLPKENAVEAHGLTDIEGLIARNAKNRHGILVTAVYWRVVEQVTATTSDARAAQPPVVAPEPLPVVPERPQVPQESAPVSGSSPRFEPIQAEEVEAFRKALANVPAQNAPKVAGEVVRSGRRNPAPMPHFADTEVDDSHSPLSGTQYGDLR